MVTSTEEKVKTKLSNALKKKREELALTQEEIAKLTGFKSNYYAKIERGEINLTLKNVHKIINSLKLDANEIFST
jgi:predicted transcriptional regulator